MFSFWRRDNFILSINHPLTNITLACAEPSLEYFQHLKLHAHVSVVLSPSSQCENVGFWGGGEHIYIYIRVYTHIIFISCCIILYNNTYVSPVCTTNLLTWHAFMVVASSQKSIKQLSFQQQKHLLLLMVRKSHSQPPKECKEPCFYHGRNYQPQVVSHAGFLNHQQYHRDSWRQHCQDVLRVLDLTPGRWEKMLDQKIQRRPFFHNLIMSISGFCSW